MTQAVAYEDAVDLLDADHKAVKKLFIDFNALCEDDAPAAKQQIAKRICQELTAHAQIEEEIFYPRVRVALGDDALMDEALQEHAEAKETIARIQEMDAGDAGYDDTVKELGKLIDEHVLGERGQMAFDFGSFWSKGQRMGTGQANVKAYNRLLSRLIEKDKVKPSWIVSHELPLERGPEAYANFDQRKNGWTKVVFKPGK